eukprot:1146613-Pelagomonas_calceolata.AAC.3
MMKHIGLQASYACADTSEAGHVTCEVAMLCMPCSAVTSQVQKATEILLPACLQALTQIADRIQTNFKCSAQVELPNARLHEKRDSLLKKILKERKGKGFIAVPAYVGSLAEAKKVPVTKPIRSREQKQNTKPSHSISSTLKRTWLILGHQPGKGRVVLYSVPITLVANFKLVWAPISMMPSDFHSKVVTGKA